MYAGKPNWNPPRLGKDGKPEFPKMQDGKTAGKFVRRVEYVRR
jgi:hypothetical protein